MKRKAFHIVLVSLLCLAVVGIGCALVQKAPTDPTQKAAWIQSTQVSLDDAAAGVNLLLIGFDVLCVANTIPPPACTLGMAADNMWLDDYAAATDALTKYAAGTITQAEAQKLVDQAMLQSLVKVTSVLKTNSTQQASTKALALRTARGVQPAALKPPKKK